MITIEHPYIEHRGNESFLCADIHDESRNMTLKTWYSVESNYAEYLTDERADAFVLVVFMIAMKSHQDILVKAPVSDRLLFNMKNTIQPLFEMIIPGGKQVKITAEKKQRDDSFRGKAVGCGCSLGVDSMSSFLRHYGTEVLSGYHATHLALFNSCQFGYVDLEQSEKEFRKAVDDLVPFSKEVNMPIVAVNTNLNELFLNSGFVTASSRFIPSTLSCVLALQKLFGKYVFASSYSIADFAISQIDHSHAESAFVPLLSTEDTEIILSNPCMTRVSKTQYISKHPLTVKFLNVCWAEQQAYGVAHITKWVEDKKKRNCGWCDKCLRTLFTLELLGVDIDKFKEGFELSKYYQHREEFIQTVLMYKDSNIMYKEIYVLMKEKQFVIPKSILFKIKRNESRIWRALSYVKHKILRK